MLTERLEPDDYAHLVVACLLHDIGYVRGLLKGDGGNSFVVDASGRRVTLPRGASDAALAPYHVERSILFVKDRLGCSPFIEAAATRKPQRTRACSSAPACVATLPIWASPSAAP